jgi:hypothetical protein
MRQTGASAPGYQVVFPFCGIFYQCQWSRKRVARRDALRDGATTGRGFTVIRITIFPFRTDGRPSIGS